MKKEDNRLLFLALFAVFILVLINLFIFTNKPSSVYCYKDVCLYGGEDPLQEISSLINGSTRAILAVEGDDEATQKSGFVSGALVVLAKDFGGKELRIIGIKFSNGQAVECICSDFNGNNFTDCPSNSTDYCLSVTPAEGELKIEIPYPAFSKNEIIVDGRTVRILAKTGPDALAMVNFFEELFIK